MDLKFEWDEHKSEANLIKHGISFPYAISIFYQDFWEQKSAYADEERFVATGKVEDEVLTVVYTWRGDVQRIISAGKASQHERKQYHDLYG